MDPYEPTPEPFTKLHIGVYAQSLYGLYISDELALTDFAGLALNATERFMEDHPQPWTAENKRTFISLMTKIGRGQNIPRPLLALLHEEILTPSVIAKGRIALVVLGKSDNLRVKPVTGFVEAFKRVGLHGISACAYYTSWNDQMIDVPALGPPYLDMQENGQLAGNNGIAFDLLKRLENAFPVDDLHRAAVLGMAEFCNPMIREQFRMQNVGNFGLLIPDWVKALTDQDLALSIAQSPEPPLTFKVLATSFSARSICELNICQVSRSFAQIVVMCAGVQKSKVPGSSLSCKQIVSWELAEIAAELVMDATQKLRCHLSLLDQGIIEASNMTEMKRLGVRYCDAIHATNKEVYGSVYSLCASSSDLTQRCENGTWQKGDTVSFLRDQCGGINPQGVQRFVEANKYDKPDTEITTQTELGTALRDWFCNNHEPIPFVNIVTGRFPPQEEFARLFQDKNPIFPGVSAQTDR